ncbi:MAG: hypothetical protein IH623_25820 [Verrucomicrobia bacterium]|nr:hypothetical protein [Verrucomicrobiota bacterium]
MESEVIIGLETHVEFNPNLEFGTESGAIRRRRTLAGCRLLAVAALAGDLG